jgi:hypothetical protein
MKTITTLLLLFLFSFSTFANVSFLERDALVKLYQATNGANWINQWDLSAPINTWYGVELYDDKVIAIHLADNNLTGSLPNEITDLVFLQTLDLHKNKIN